MEPKQYVNLTIKLDDLVRDFSIKHDIPRHQVCIAIRNYIDPDMIHDLILEEVELPPIVLENEIPTNKILDRITEVQESHIGKKAE